MTKDAHQDAMIAHYRLERELGRGGQGTVYLAWDLRLSRQVALKLMPGRRHPTATEIRRFRREARLAASLEHPDIAGVYDSGIHKGVPFLVMQHVEGQTLANHIESARAPGETSLRLPSFGSGEPGRAPPGTGAILLLMERTARALHEAHERGIVHRDVKPGNIMVTAEGRPVLLDFGLARGDDPGVTATGEVLGTPSYMSPEQLEGDPRLVDRRADIYSLGVTLFECLTLSRPFQHASRERLYESILQQAPPDPRRFNPAVSQDLRALIVTALEKSPDRRYQTAEDLAEDLARVRRGEPISVRAPGLYRRVARLVRRHPGIATAVFMLLAVLGTSLAVSLALLGSERKALAAEKEELERIRKDQGRAQRADADAEEHLRRYERLADARRCEELSKESQSLWPRLPSTIPAMDAWLRAAHDLVAGLPEHAAALQELEATGAGTHDEDGPRLPNAQDRWRYDLQRALLEKLTRLSSTIADVEERRTWSSTIERRSVLSHRAAWDRAIDGVAHDPRTRNLDLAPQVGLVPLGADPDSGLQEFCDIAFGDVPERDPETGRLVLTDAFGLVLVLIPGGTFLMGAQPADPSAPNYDRWAMTNEAPVHEVRLDPFFLSKYELTQAQYHHATGLWTSRHTGPRRPVDALSWTVAMEHLGHFGLLLPTEAQWEYACRAGTSTPWWTGESPESLIGAINIGDQASRRAGGNYKISIAGLDDGHAHHAPVGTYRPNPFGLHEMHGNMNELCADTYVSSGPHRAGDGLRWDDDVPYRSVRGASYADEARNARSSARYRVGPDTRQQGVRPARRIISDQN